MASIPNTKRCGSEPPDGPFPDSYSTTKEHT